MNPDYSTALMYGMLGASLALMVGAIIGIIRKRDGFDIMASAILFSPVGFIIGGLYGYSLDQVRIEQYASAEIGPDEYARIRSWRGASRTIDAAINDASKDGIINRTEADRIWSAVDTYQIEGQRCLTTGACGNNSKTQAPVAKDK